MEMMALSIALVSIIGSFIVILAIVLTAIRSRNRRNEMLHQERMMAIEKGLPIPPDYLESTARRRPYVRGLVWSALGLGLMVLGWINAMEDGDWGVLGVGVVFLFIGLALLAGDKLTTKKANGFDASSLQYSAAELERPVEGNRS